MKSSEARKMPEPSAEDKRKAELGEQMSREMEAGAAREQESMSFGDRFAADADSFNELLARADAKSKEIASLDKNPLGADQSAAKAALVKERDSIRRAMDDMTGKYGDGADEFFADAMRKNDLDKQLADKKGKLRELMGMKEFMNYPGGQRGAEAEKQFLKERIADLQADEAELLAGYDAKEKAGRAELAGLTQDEIDRVVDFNIFEGEDYLDSPQFGAELDKVLGKLQEAPVVTAREATEAERKEVMEAVTDEYLESDEFAASLDAALENAKKVQEKKARVEAMTKRVDAHIARIEEAEDVAAEREAQREQERKLEKAIKDARDFGGLSAALRDAGIVHGGRGRAYEGTELADMVDLIAKYPNSPIISGITRRHGLREKVSALAEAAKADVYEEVGEEDIVEVQPEKMPLSKKEMKLIEEHNELLPERRAEYMQEIAEIDEKIKVLEEGTRMEAVVDPATGLPDFEALGPDSMKAGYKTLEKEIKDRYGIDMELAATSLKEKVRLEFKMLMNGRLRERVGQYRESLAEANRLWSEQASLRELVTDPKKHMERMRDQRERLMVLAARQVQRGRASSGGGPLGRAPS